jgi:CRP/FNR family transcriptional regulator
MWVFNQYVFGSAASRLANFLFEQSNLQQTDTLNKTNEAIANDLGTAREVITRLLKHFTADKVISQTRGTIKIEDKKELKKPANCRVF